MRKQIISSKTEKVGTRSAHVLRYIDEDGSRVAVYGLVTGMQVTQNGKIVPINGSHEIMWNEWIGKPARAAFDELKKLL